MLEFAQKYLDAGFSIIPLAPNSKRPALETWAEFQQRRPTLDEVAQWWQNGSNYGIAVVCGKVSNLIVLDIDDETKFGVALKAIGEALPDTPIVRTRKGWHLYFRYPANRIVRRHDRLNDWGAELRGDGHYVVAPPSVVDGHRYRWATRSGKHMALGEVPIADCPEWLLDAFGVPFADEQNEPALVQLSQPIHQSANGNALTDEQRRALKSILVPHWVEGCRHDLALGFAGLLAKSGISQDEALMLLREIASEAGDDEWRDRERALKDTFDRLWRGEQVIGFKRLEEIVGEQTAKIVAAIVSPQKPNDGRQPIGLLTLAEWDERLAHISQGQWLVEGLLQAGWLLVINARPKVGKSIVSVNLATALAEGTPFLNLPTSPCAVVYVDLERPIETLNRFKALNAVSNPNIFVPAERIGADTPDALRELVKQAHDLTNRPVVVFVDTLGDFLKPALRQRKASINDYDAIAEILQALRDLALELGCAFVFVHHTRKAQSEEPTEVDVLGSTAIAGKFDVIAHLQPDRTDTSILALTVEGNAIAKATLHFAIGDGFRVTPCEPPAKTKEEQAAREIRRLLERRPEGLQRSELIRYLLDIGLAETEDGAMRLFHRAIKLLPIEAKRSGQRTVYVLTGERLIPAEPTEGKSDKRDTYREFVTLVTHPEKPQQNKAEKEVTSDCLSCHSSPENSDNSDNSDNIGLSHMSRLSHIASENSDKPHPRCHTSCHSQNASKIRASAECVTTVTNPISVSHLSHIQTPEPPSPEPPEPAYATLRDNELVDAETLIAELEATEPTPEPQNSETNLSQTEKYVDTEKWLDELCAELTANQPEPTEPTDIEVLVWQCERCGRVFERLVEADLFGSPKCRVCGGTLKLQWQRGDKP
jgi:protein-arginine kinase activator protein McsA